MIAALATLAMGITACSETDAEADQGKMPSVQYVRMCDPNLSDSLLVKASLGQRIAFIGENLGDVQQIYFNDQKALLNPNLVTSNSIIVDVPSNVPADVNNIVRFVTSTGLSYEYPFSVVVPNPVLTSISCQYASPGEELTITGDYFLGSDDKPVKVKFPGVDAITIDPANYTQQTLHVTVPEGATEEGAITVESMYGSTRSSFTFLETTGMITNFDDGYVNPWGYPTGAPLTETGISGKYLQFYCQGNGAWNWTDKLMWGYWASSNTPIASGDITKLGLRFECNIITWSDCPVLFWFANYVAGGAISPDDNYSQAHWKPWNNSGENVDAATNGWVTVTIPLTDFKYNKEESVDNLSVGDISQYSNLNVMMFGAANGSSDVNILFDNFRIVPID